MTTIAQVSDVENLLGAANLYAATQIGAGLSWASSFIREYCQQQFDYVQSDVVTIDPRPDHTAQLPEAPVLNVESVQAYMADPITGVWDWQPLTMFAFVARGLIWDTTNVAPPIIPTANIPLQSWPTTPGSLKVTYDHGFMAAGATAYPQPLIDCCARLACQYLENPTLMTERRVGSVMGRFGTTSGGVQLSALDAAILDRFAVVDLG
ncbi:hypothetical protein [Speluncibacter jeojiensis]|uniref:Head-to-tail adaptor n=1 Tax=Speluncibacter jeojiensis TaxID=2710754 RepID=A0A9X4RG16_9ACTN|nr:hypothetical protein [Corynebacteriales bacterium D3-21]